MPQPGATVIDPSVPPSGPGCLECDQSGGWWLHLRRCAACGHIGCCDNSPSQHATGHFEESGHPIMRSYEPDEDWFWDYELQGYVTLDGPDLTGPVAHPLDQSVPGPVDRVPPGWRSLLH